MSRDTHFYYSFLVLPAAKRRAIIAVWDFCHAIDDTVDQAGRDERGELSHRAEAARALDAWRRELAACFDGTDPQTEQGRALVPYVRAFPLPRTAFEAVIDGVEMDLDERHYETFEELQRYCERVASAVGLIAIEIFGYEDPRSREYARNLGIALQLTNIVRDVPVDLARRRLYVPLEDLARFECEPADLARGELTAKVAALMRHQCARARAFYRAAAAVLPPADAKGLVAAEIMGAIYFELLRRIERTGYDVFTRPIRVPRPQRAVIAARTWLRLMLARQPRSVAKGTTAADGSGRRR
ncbi:MAG: presqualene diphosphate synthase HpnD [Acidobacteria bacterium]|nr:presqualene diphosphate synthase HpnD [Acidobacteriota bacterium]